MSSAASRRLYEDQIPSFMSVFKLGAETMDEQHTAANIVDQNIIGLSDPAPETQFLPGHLHRFAQQSSSRQPSDCTASGLSSLPCDPSHRHHDSTSTQTSESADSSPTTTMSCTDSSSLSDPSPSSSPDSPVNNLAPLASFSHASFGALRPISLGMASLTIDSGLKTQERPMTSPSPRRHRNMKGLSIQPPFVSPSLSAASLVSEPCSPSFIKPQIPAMKRKPSQLSLKTSKNDLVKSTTLDIPQSPLLIQPPPILQRRALKHSTSSPHMLSSLRSATFGPVGGMTIPTVLERNESGLSEFLRPSRPAPPVGLSSAIAEEESPIRTQMANRATFDFEPYHENENNEDQKTPGYPDGPIAIYDDNVFLYLEPTAEEAARFDVVINVAREVKNPFQNRTSHPAGKPSLGLEQSSKPTAGQAVPPPALLAAVWEEPQQPLATVDRLAKIPEVNTPTTSKAPLPLKEPEYIHMEWDHNTDIGQDLMALCEKIESKTKEGKKVLIHCQQGASRSASLIIAYGIYQRPELSVNDAYLAAQAKSKWISPNMRLMYCLQDFQKEMSKKRRTPSSSFHPRSGRSPSKHRAVVSMDAIEIPPKEPLSAPLPAEENSPMGATPSPKKGPMRPRGNSTPSIRETAGPSPVLGPSAPTAASFVSTVPSMSAELAAPAAPAPNSSSSWGREELDEKASFFSRLNFDLPVTLKPPPMKKFPTFNLPEEDAASSSWLPASFMKPPPSPGFAAHRFGQFSFGDSGNNNDGSNNNNSSSNGKRAPAHLSTLPAFAPLKSPGLPPPRSPGNDGLDSILSKSMATQEPWNAAPVKAPEPPVRESAMPIRENAVAICPTFPDDEPLMSPRAETMTKNPLHNPFAELAGMRFVEVPPTPSDGLFSPRQTMFPRDPFYPFGRPTQVADPRSPPTQGETPIVRSIDDLI